MAQPFGALIVGAQVCALGVTVFGFLTAQQESYGNGSAAGGTTVVQAVKAKSVV